MKQRGERQGIEERKVGEGKRGGGEREEEKGRGGMNGGRKWRDGGGSGEVGRKGGGKEGKGRKNGLGGEGTETEKEEEGW